MKRWLIAGITLLVLFLLGCQLIIPKEVVVTKTVVANANLNAVFRYLGNDSNWAKWWPAANGMGSAEGLKSGKHWFRKTQTRYNSFGIEIGKDNEKKNSVLSLLAIGNDSVRIVWSTTIQAAGNNPFGKINLYLEAQDLRKNFESILSAMNSHVSKVKNLYGFDISFQKIKSEFTVSTRKTLPRYPNTEDIYGMISAIETYIARQPAKTEDLPILHIKAEDSVNYDLLVAIPVDKPVPDSGIYKTKKLLRNGNILVTEFKGGTHMSQQALRQVDTYAMDHGFRSIALPYQTFLTDRTAEKDTSKWHTRISYPVL